jgi:hypothetical protein
MADRNQSERTFKPTNRDTLDDIAKFNTTAKMLEDQGKITIFKQPDAWRLVKKVVPIMETATPSLDKSDASAAQVAKTPWRVSLEAMKRQVESVEYLHPQTIPHMTIAVVLLKNGYALQGMSAPADPENYNEERGREFAYEDALRKMWPLEAYVMRDVLSERIELVGEEQAAERWGS